MMVLYIGAYINEEPPLVEILRPDQQKINRKTLVVVVT
jgi:hypothetical protein